MPSADIFRLDLCVTELVTNIVDHGDRSGPEREILLLLTDAHATQRIQVDIIDSGPAFDPLKDRPSTPPAHHLENAGTGGLGLRLVAGLADKIGYVRREHQNVVTIVLDCSAPAVNGRDAGGINVARGIERREPTGPPVFPITRADGQIVTCEARRRDERRRFGFVSECELFRNVPYHLIENLIADLPIRAFADGEVLLRPGDRNHYVAIVLRGGLRVRLGSEDSPDTTEIKAGSFAGEMSVIDGKPVSAYVFASGDCRLMVIDAATFLTRLLPIPEVARNLIGTLADRMRLSNDRIIERFRSTLELETLQRELQFARQVQASLVPERMTLAPARPGVQCVGFMRSAQQVGGDFYDAFYVQPNRLFLVMGDVCGKGMPAALYMSRTMTLLRSEALHATGRTQREHTLDIAERTNRALCRHNDTGYFASVFLAVLDVSTGLLTWVNAGHPAPALARGSSPPRFLGAPHGMLMGVSEEVHYAVGETPLPPGSQLVLYTDGASEAENSGGSMFGDMRLLQLLNQAKQRDPAAIIQAIVDAIEAFVQDHPQSDDLTLLVMRYSDAV